MAFELKGLEARLKSPSGGRRFRLLLEGLRPAEETQGGSFAALRRPRHLCPGHRDPISDPSARAGELVRRHEERLREI